jgi:hypothetical protein
MEYQSHRAGERNYGKSTNRLKKRLGGRPHVFLDVRCMGKSKMMGAGNASATLYKSNPNLNTGGGLKKQGITSRVGLDNWENREIQTQSNGIGRFKLVCMNQLGGVGPGMSMFGGRWNRADGVHCRVSDSILPSLPNASCLVFTESPTGIQSGEIDGNKIIVPTIPYNLQNVTKILINLKVNNNQTTIFLPVNYVSANTFIIQLPDTFITQLNNFNLQNIFFTVSNTTCLPFSTVNAINTGGFLGPPFLTYNNVDKQNNNINITSISPISCLPANVNLTYNGNTYQLTIVAYATVINISATYYNYLFSSYVPIDYTNIANFANIQIC